MLATLRANLTYANVMATIAVFVALGGSSYAAIALGKNDVKSIHIAKGEVKRSDIANGAVNSAKTADFSLLAKDFRPGQIPAGPQGPKGDTGPQGPKGDMGPPGLPGEPAATQVVMRVQGPGAEQVFCNFGEVAVGGGGIVMGGGFLTQSQPLPFSNATPPTGWVVNAANADASDASATAWVVCAS